jgi:hypothetical protein
MLNVRNITMRFQRLIMGDIYEGDEYMVSLSMQVSDVHKPKYNSELLDLFRVSARDFLKSMNLNGEIKNV